MDEAHTAKISPEKYGGGAKMDTFPSRVVYVSNWALFRRCENSLKSSVS